MGIVVKALRKAKNGAGSPAAGVPAGGARKGGTRPGPAPGPSIPARVRPAPAARPPGASPIDAGGSKPPEASPAPPPVRPSEGPPQPKPSTPPGRKPSRSARPGSGRVHADLVSLLNPTGPEAELFRALRTRILFPQNGKRPPRTILVTSALAGEGKSFMAANLAITIAQNVDEHVLLVDCDLRKPSICNRFGFAGAKGLSDYLSRGVELAPLLLKTEVQKLTLLPSGTPPPNPSELISSSRMAALLEELKLRYQDRYIILDSPPPIVAPETSAIAQWVDGILVVVKYGTPMDLVEELLAHLDRDKLIGTVINKFNPREFRRYAYRKYYDADRYYRA